MRDGWILFASHWCWILKLIVYFVDKMHLTLSVIVRKQSKRSIWFAVSLVYFLIPRSTFSQQFSQSDLPDSVSVAASYAYSQPSFFRKIFMGKNYRKEWETPVKLPVLNLTKLGLIVEELGGGRQTKSLRLLDKDSAEWALRTVDKDVRPAIPKLIRNGFTVSIVQDMVSAAHPYAPLTVPMLADAVGVHAAQPTFYYVPDDTSLGKFRSLFAGTVCLLEKRDLIEGVKTKSTEKMLGDLFEHQKSQLNQAAYLNARLLDMAIADWDRHYDQWKWAELDSGKRTIYLALPKDRDQAYFSSQGWLLKIIRLLGMKFTVGFTDETDNLVKLNSVAWNLDRLLLNELSREDWTSIAREFQNNLKDDVIQNAVKELPDNIYSMHGALITQKLLSRKNTLASGVLKYYSFLSKEVTIHGTDKAEHFDLTGNKDSVTLTVRPKDDVKKIGYKRTFYPNETKKIKLLGLDGDDVFSSNSDLQTAIRFEIDGGAGNNDNHLSKYLKIKLKNTDLDAKGYLKKLRKPLRIRDEE